MMQVLGAEKASMKLLKRFYFPACELGTKALWFTYESIYKRVLLSHTNYHLLARSSQYNRTLL